MPASRDCPNCGTPAPDNFCPHCGQMQIERRITLRHVLDDLIEDQFGITDRAPKTFHTLLLQPGQLSADYFQGRIQRYIEPFKLYLLVSVLFFLSAGLFGFRGATTAASVRISAAMQRAQNAALARGDTTRVSAVMGLSLTPRHFIGLRLQRFPTDNWLRDSKVNFGFASLNRIAERHLHDLARLGDERGTRQLMLSIFQQIPKVIFVLLPVYALLLFALYHRKRRYYVEHFVFSLHVHAFAFLALTLAWIPISWIRPLVLIAVAIYVVVAQRRFYGQSYPVVVAKSLLLGIAYLVIVGFGVVASLALALTTS